MTKFLYISLFLLLFVLGIWAHNFDLHRDSWFGKRIKSLEKSANEAKNIFAESSAKIEQSFRDQRQKIDRHFKDVHSSFQNERKSSFERKHFQEGESKSESEEQKFEEQQKFEQSNPGLEGFFAQGLETMVNSFSEKSKLKELIQNTDWSINLDDPKVKSWLNHFSEWKDKGLAGVQTVLKEADLTEVQEMIRNGIDKAVRIKDAVLDASLEDLESLSNQIDLSVDGITRFFQTKHFESQDNGKNLNVDVTVDIYEDAAKNTREKLQCLNTIMNSDIELDSREDSSLGIWCNDRECQRCLLWMFLSAQKERLAKSQVPNPDRKDEDLVQSALIP